jgi:16S rRNA (cytidine1402-2'-O)-methyltransferase
LVIAGASADAASAADLVEQAIALAESGTGLKSAVAELSEAFGVSKSELYQLVLERRKSES